jgi:hypothetical protein
MNERRSFETSRTSHRTTHCAISDVSSTYYKWYLLRISLRFIILVTMARILRLDPLCSLHQRPDDYGTVLRSRRTRVGLPASLENMCKTWVLVWKPEGENSLKIYVQMAAQTGNEELKVLLHQHMHYILIIKSITPTYVSAYNRSSSGGQSFLT